MNTTEKLQGILAALVDEIADLRLSVRLLAAAAPPKASLAQIDEARSQVKDVFGDKFEAALKQ